ncbi:hypothetical protein [Variovorax ginsengisoli]|uniref:hypothetical protein n=1 Tax=Variovorax ginsengisoli TaxID=363844 RepID=UPI0027D7901D|nr:hypothetical protein [Variovorax ginsengisoli]
MASSAELELEGNRLLVTGALDGTALTAFKEHLASDKVRTVVFENSTGGNADVAESYAAAIRASGVRTEMIGQCQAACAYAFLAGTEHRFGRGLYINALMIPVASRPQSADLVGRWRGVGVQKTLADLSGPAVADTSLTADLPAAPAAEAPPPDNWRPDHGVLFTSTPTLFGRIYNTYYCDGTQGRDVSKCELLSDADPYKLGVLTP